MITMQRIPLTGDDVPAIGRPLWGLLVVSVLFYGTVTGVLIYAGRKRKRR